MIRLCGLALLVACSSSGDEPSTTAQPPAAPANTTPNQLLSRGAPTFVVGTAGDDRTDTAVAAQVALIRGIAFPNAPAVDDAAVTAWPDNPVVYGGPHVNQLVARVADTLPFTLGPGRLVIGGRTFEGEDVRLITVVPAAGERPEFLLYAGTGTPGVGEINGVSHGPAPILIADGFGPLHTGRWTRNADGAIVAQLDPAARRIAWRTVERGHVRFRFPEQLPAADDEAEVIEIGARAVRTAVTKLAIDRPATIDIYVYPDRGSKESLTGNSGDGHAVVAARALHVLRGGAFELLVAHEATHLLAYEAWGPAGTPLLGEGLAVWVSGAYGGKPLDDYRGAFDAPPSVAELLGPSFRKLPEPTTYPLAGLFVDAAIAEVGIDKLRAHLLAASPADWAAACARAETTPAALQNAYETRLR